MANSCLFAISSTIKPDSTVFITPSVCPPLMPLANKETNETAATIFFREADTKVNTMSCSSHSTSVSSSSAGLFISQDHSSALAGLNKTEQTLFINSDGTQATLITPVVSAIAADGGQSATVITADGGGVGLNLSKSYGGQTLLTAPTINFSPVLNSSLSVESIGKFFPLSS